MNIIVPEPVLSLVIDCLNRDISNGKAKISRNNKHELTTLRNTLITFIENNKAAFPEFTARYKHKGFPSDHILKRAFNKKDPYGAARITRDLLARYCTDGKHDWKGLLENHFSGQFDHLLKKEEGILKTGAQDNLSKILSAPLTHQIGETELKLIIEQLRKPDTTENNPDNPVFPPHPYKPKFPASETYKISIEGFTNTWLKDESTNPTGTHKDRMAYEVLRKASSNNWPAISLISSGSAAIAIQNLFNLYNSPTQLRVLVDHKLDPGIKEAIREKGSVVYETDLSKELLTSKRIKELTQNNYGVDITYRETLDSHNIIYYDWMSYEIINSNPEYCFIPFGTGDLFINVLNIVEKEFNNKEQQIRQVDKRFRGNIDIVSHCHFIGCTTVNPSTKLEKLFSYHLPSLEDYTRRIDKLIKFNCIGNKSRIEVVEEEFVNLALEIANEKGITCEPSGIAGLAMLLQMKSQIPADSKVLVVNTGKTKYQ
jgi:cysteine synthase